MPCVIVVALSSEAQPLVQSFGLRSTPGAQAFRSFQSEQIHLVVSGIGKIMAAAACGWIGARICPDGGDHAQPICWINAGICGHGKAQVGSVLRPSLITDHASGRRVYPPNLFRCKLGAGELLSIDKVEREYGRPCAYDMEASAFWDVATRFSTAELCTCLKVVSDGPEADVDTLDKDRIRQLSENLVLPVQDAVTGLSKLATEVTEPALLRSQVQECIERWHFSVTRQRQLRQLLSALLAAGALEQRIDDELKMQNNAQSVLDVLDARLRALPVTLTGNQVSEAVE